MKWIVKWQGLWAADASKCAYWSGVRCSESWETELSMWTTSCSICVKYWIMKPPLLLLQWHNLNLERFLSLMLHHSSHIRCILMPLSALWGLKVCYWELITILLKVKPDAAHKHSITTSVNPRVASLLCFRKHYWQEKALVLFWLLSGNIQNLAL